MYINIIVSENERGFSYLTFDKKVVDNLTETCIIDTWSQASNVAKSFVKSVKTISLKDFILTKDGNKSFENFCLQSAL